jgi:pimeloyl-ACP methyl ester carboxylesterase
MFPGFTPFRIATEGAEIAGVRGGAGPPLLLLHGYPQTHVMWHKTAPALARRFTVVAADLRGYGASSKPPTTEDHAPYSKRAMAADMVEVMAALGHPRFMVAAHDRGARVAHRMAADRPEAVSRLAVLDIAPTREMYAGTTAAFAHAYWHWFFLTLPAPRPERMIGADPRAFWLEKCGAGSAGLAPFTPAALRGLPRRLHARDDPRELRGLPCRGRHRHRARRRRRRCAHRPAAARALGRPRRRRALLRSACALAPPRPGRARPRAPRRPLPRRGGPPARPRRPRALPDGGRRVVSPSADAARTARDQAGAPR